MVKAVLHLKPVTITRVSLFEGDLEERIKKFNPDFFKKAPQSDILAYGLLNRNPLYFINISCKTENPIDYNTLLLITSYSDRTNNQTLQKFQQITAIDFSRPAPPRTGPMIRAYLTIYELILDIYKEHPNETIDFLKKLVRES